MGLRLTGLVCDGAGLVNEDRAGYLGDAESVHAAWVLDGVTGINRENLYPGGSDAAWLVTEVDRALQDLVKEPVPLPVILTSLVDHLVASASRETPPDFDPPACCLLLVRYHEGRWDAARLGDASLLVQEANGAFFQYTEFPLQWLDRELKVKASAHRLRNMTEEQIIDEFRPMLRASRQQRNQPGGYGILEADPRCLDFVQYIAMEEPASILLATDGFFRLVDTYHVYDEEGLLQAAAAQGPETLLTKMRAIEKSDDRCLKYPRFKPHDDAAALCLASEI